MYSMLDLYGVTLEEYLKRQDILPLHLYKKTLKDIELLESNKRKLVEENKHIEKTDLIVEINKRIEIKRKKLGDIKRILRKNGVNI